ncbi:YfhO family protein [Emticicia agri]|uniref:YfhO family protein n=1 Tax=Emticicia agri TaxID=2492393 RepID=A0A4V1ZCS8_9BACT|nr:YfhO family protein [Emticicia agri]RYU93710.1 hypothetical protein EWM59_20545 [Emticicia agri]
MVNQPISQSTYLKYTGAYVVLSFICLLCLFWKFLFSDSYLLFKDIGNDSYYQAYAYLKAINALPLKNKFLSWSFSFGTGQLVSGIYTGNIFNWPLFFIDSASIAKGMLFMECLKLFLTGFIYFRYLINKAYHPLISVFGGCLVMLSSFMVINAGWFTYFSYFGFLWVLWLFSLEQLLKGRLYWLIVAVLLTAIDQSYNLYIFGLFSLAYFLLHNYSFKTWKQILLRLSITYLYGIGIGAVLLGANLFIISHSPRFDPQYSYFKELIQVPMFELISLEELKTAFFRLFSNNIEGIGDNFTGWNNYIEAPLFFISSLGLLLLTQYLHKRGTKLYVKHILICVAILFLLLFPFFRASIWLFSANYYRILSFCIGLLLFEAGLNILDYTFFQKFQLHTKLLFYNFSAILVLFFFFTALESLFYYKALLLIILFFILLLYSTRKQNKTFLLSMFGLALVDSIVESYASINLRPIVTTADLKGKKGFNDFSQDAVNWIHSIDRGFYRMEKDFSSGDAKVFSTNDAMIQGFKGTKVYTSFNHLSYINYLKGMEEIKFESEYTTRWLTGNLDKFEMLDNLAVKYMISNGIFDWTQVGYQLVKTFNKVKVYRNPGYKPMGTVFNNIISEADYGNLPLEKKRTLIKEYVVIPDKMVDKIAEVASNTPTLTSVDRTDAHLDILTYDHNHILGKVRNKDLAVVYFSIPFDEGWHIEIDGKETEKFIANYGMTGILLAPGKHSIQLYYKLPYLEILIVISVSSVVSLFFLRKHLFSVLV